MAVGKQSLGRVAQSGVIGATSPAVTAEAEKQAAPAPKAAKKTVAKETAATKTAVKEVKNTSAVNKIYAVGDKLPEYLL